MPVDLSLIGALTAAVGTLGGVVAYMGKFFMKNFEELKSEVSECRRDREKLWERITQINDRLDKQ